jgi:hypothetical protein
MTLWYRHEGDTRWHTGCAVGASFVTLCNGRWALSDGDAVENMEQPPQHERCEKCERESSSRARIEHGLAELATAPTQRQLRIHERFDIGGES